MMDMRKKDMKDIKNQIFSNHVQLQSAVGQTAKRPSFELTRNETRTRTKRFLKKKKKKKKKRVLKKDKKRLPKSKRKK